MRQRHNDTHPTQGTHHENILTKKAQPRHRSHNSSDTARPSSDTAHPRQSCRKTHR
ncbi:hypothetical protein [Moraxella lacunata]|uniref:hypothetical protein n=1 Tax=Moraxella lacunata TaxID=477 RepID=UPI003EE13E7D